MRCVAWLGMVLAILAGAVSTPALAQGQSPPPVTFERSALTIATARGSIRFDVELAVSEAQKERGLMFRTALDPYTGMLFDFRQEQPVAMWMKNTPISLDMLFIAADGRIVRIAANTVPESLATIASGRPVRAVLEIAGGTARLLGIREGDRVEHPIFGTAAGG